MAAGSAGNRRLIQWLVHTFGNALLVVGVLVLVGAGAIYAYGTFKQAQFEQEAIEIQKQLASQDVDIPDDPVPTLLLSAVPTSADPTAPRQTLPPIRVLVPTIDVDSLVVETGIKDGEWQVPKFVVGHLDGTANPGENGNMTMSGHVSSVASGNVFARLDQARNGEDVYVYTKAGQYLYRVYEIKIVPNNDISVLDPTPDPTLTLITCAGTWNPIARDYSHRLIVKARLFQDAAPENPAIRPR